MRRSCLSKAVLYGVLVLGVGCGSDGAAGSNGEAGAAGSTGANGGASSSGGGAGEDENVVELFSWWTAPGEAEALQAMVDVYRQNSPGGRVHNAALDSGDNAREVLAERLDAEDPPDLFQENANELPGFLKANPDALYPLDDLFDTLELADVVFPEVLEDVTIGGRVVAMPINVHRENTLFYNVELFEDHDMEPPETFPDFLSVCETLKEAGVTPIATSHQGWIQRIMFNTIAMGSMGAKAYHDYFTSGGERHQEELLTALDVYAHVLENYTNPDAADADFGWDAAAEAVQAGEAAMFLHGDWAKGYFVQLGWDPGVDFGAVGAPGASELFLYGVDVFALPAGAKNRRGALEFLKAVASVDGQVAFNTIKGSSPMRSDVPPTRLDEVGRATLDDLADAEYRMLVATPPAWDDALAQYAEGRDIETLRQAITENPPE